MTASLIDCSVTCQRSFSSLSVASLSLRCVMSKWIDRYFSGRPSSPLIGMMVLAVQNSRPFLSRVQISPRPVCPRFLLFVEVGEQVLQRSAHVIEYARGLLQFGWTAGANGRARAVIPGLDPVRGGAQPGQVLQIDFQQHMRQPAAQGESGGEQHEQSGAEMPEKIFIGTGRRLDHQVAMGGAADDEGRT